VHALARTLILVGLILIALGVVVRFFPSLPMLGKLPGDLRIERPGVRLYVPLTTCLVLSALISLVVWLVQKLK